MKKLLVIFTSAIIFFLIPSVSFSTTIDFRNTLPWFSAKGSTSFSHTYTSGDLSGLTVNLTASPAGAKLWQDNTDGLGIIDSWENDEIEWNELLNISFSSTIKVNKISFADLFIEWGYTEKGRYSYDDGANWSYFSAVENIGSSNGELTIDVDLLTDSIWFKGDESLGRGKAEFAVQKIDVALIPESTTLILLGTGLIGVAALRRKIKQ